MPKNYLDSTLQQSTFTAPPLTEPTPFEDVVAKYQKSRHLHNTFGVFGDEETPCQVYMRPHLVRPMIVDFIIDVENAARKVLVDPSQQAHFFDHYRDRDGDPGEVTADMKDIDAKVQLKLGIYFKKVGLYPVKNYMRPVDIRGRRLLRQTADTRPQRIISPALTAQNARRAMHQEDDAGQCQDDYIRTRDEMREAKRLEERDGVPHPMTRSFHLKGDIVLPMPATEEEDTNFQEVA